MLKIKISSLSVIILLLGGMHFVYATWWTWWYGNEIIEVEAGCEESKPEIVIEEWCTDPFFQDMAKKQAAEDTTVYDDFIPLPEPWPSPDALWNDTVPQAIKANSFKEQIMKNNITDTKTQDLIQEPIEEREVKVIKQEVILPRPQSKNQKENIIPTTIPKEILPTKVENTHKNNEITKTHSAFEITSVSISELYKPLVLLHTDSVLKNDWTLLVKAKEVIQEDNNEHASAINSQPAIMWAIDIRNNYLREIFFISFLIFILFAVLFI